MSTRSNPGTRAPSRSTPPKPPPIARDWLSKTLAGAIGGFGLAIAASGLLACIAPGGLWIANKFQVAMWLVPPVWIGVASASFLFASGRRAWWRLGAANALAFGLLAAIRHFHL